MTRMIDVTLPIRAGMLTYPGDPVVAIERISDMRRGDVSNLSVITMLIYLDNATSVGPDSRAGRARDKGLNENLARELLELHTLGVDGGYTQTDVQEFAKILTGWSVGRPKSEEAGQFRFHPMIHESGDKTLLGKRYDEGGMLHSDLSKLSQNVLLMN